MIAKRLDQIIKDDVDSLIASAVSEGRTIEYKQELPRGTDDGKKEFLADVSSFANASGGDLLFGIEEERDANGKPTGTPNSAPGLSGINADEAIQRMENMIRDGIEPRIPGIQTKAIAGFANGPVILMRLPHSFAAPHMVTFKSSPRFFSRTSVGKAPLDVAEIRAAFLQSESIPEKIRSFREGRLGNILAGETSEPLEANNVVAVHFVPLSAISTPQQIDPKQLESYQIRLPIPSDLKGFGRLNLDGYVHYNWGAGPLEKIYAYTQIFRSGIVEHVDCFVLTYENGNERYIRLHDVEMYVMKCLRNTLPFYVQTEVEAPLFIFLSILNVRGYRYHAGSATVTGLPKKVDRPHLIFPEVQIDDVSAQNDQEVRPLFDMLWQSCGFRQSPNFGEDDSWRSPV